MKKLLGLLSASVLVLSACGGGGSEDAAAADGGAVIDTKFGEVTVPEDPERVVALGWGDAEVALELGTEPVGASDWLAFGGDGVGPWSPGYETSPEIIETLEPNFEKVAALDPDLILDVRSSGDQQRYDRLSSIAPTVGVPEGGDNYLTEPEKQVEMIAAALGKEKKGEELLADADQAFTEAAEAHSEWDGHSVTVATRTSEGWGAYTSGESRVEFMERLGFTQSEQIASMEPDEGGFSAPVSDEQLDLLDADLLIGFPIFIDTSQITENPQWQAIPAVQDGRSVVIDGALSQAYSEGTPAAQRWAVEKLVPKIEKTGVGQQ